MNQLKTLLWLRYRLLLASLQGRQTKGAFWFVLVTLGVLVLISLGAGWGIYLSLTTVVLPRRMPLEPSLAALFWAILWFQALIALAGQASGTVDPRRFLLYPIPLQRLFALTGLTIVVDLSFWFVLPSVFATGLAPTLALGLGGWGWGLVGLGVLWCAVISLTLQVGLARLLNQGGRETLTALLIGALTLLPQAIVLGQHLFPTVLTQAWLIVKPWLPPSALAAGLGSEQVSTAGLVVAGWSVALLLLSYEQFKSLALQIESGNRRAPQWNLRLGFTWWGLPLPVCAVVTKQLYYLSRNPLSYIFLIPMVALFVGLGQTQPGVWVVLIALSTIYVFSAQSFNSTFAFDHHGFKTYRLSPVGWSSILLGHNLAQQLWLLPQILGGIVLFGWLRGKLELDLLLSGMTLWIMLGVAYSLVGNWFSITQPVRLGFGMQRRSNGLSVGLIVAPFVGLAINGVILIPFILLKVGTGWSPLLNYIGMTLGMGLALLLYPAGLKTQARLLEEQQDQVLAQLTVID